MICKNCGNPLNESDTFCSKCGSPIENSNNTIGQSNNLNSNMVQTNDVNSSVVQPDNLNNPETNIQPQVSDVNVQAQENTFSSQPDVAPIPVQAEQNNVANNNVQPQIQTENKNNNLFVIILVVLVIIIGVLVYLLVFKKDSGTTNNGNVNSGGSETQEKVVRPDSDEGENISNNYNQSNKINTSDYTFDIPNGYSYHSTEDGMLLYVNNNNKTVIGINTYAFSVSFNDWNQIYNEYKSSGYEANIKSKVVGSNTYYVIDAIVDGINAYDIGVNITGGGTLQIVYYDARNNTIDTFLSTVGESLVKSAKLKSSSFVKSNFDISKIKKVNKVPKIVK